MSTRNNRLQELPAYTVPPDVINGGFKVFGLNLFQLIIIGLATVLGLTTMFLMPIDLLPVRLLGGLVVWMTLTIYFLVPTPALTFFEQTLNYMSYRKANIPTQTTARPLPRTAVTSSSVISSSQRSTNKP